ncbi:hypothetical protein RRG08_044069 [Elysia crispata]|uniref:Uncharacterized protein n=1 Tax=Elysia crispata TaxID=231223 RepID=A0AAE0Y2I0_9GAST|nr:hypothetical protein RRG08_044069 [Elysia crispata]
MLDSGQTSHRYEGMEYAQWRCDLKCGVCSTAVRPDIGMKWRCDLKYGVCSTAVRPHIGMKVWNMLSGGVTLSVEYARQRSDLT